MQEVLPLAALQLRKSQAQIFMKSSRSGREHGAGCGWGLPAWSRAHISEYVRPGHRDPFCTQPQLILLALKVFLPGSRAPVLTTSMSLLLLQEERGMGEEQPSNGNQSRILCHACTRHPWLPLPALP